jgi:uncharacterized SAM-binding protein YcdF (DUF218 family)
LLWLLGVGCLLAGLYAFRAPLLAGLARAWVVDDPLTRADVIVVLGGGPSTRPFEAAHLYHAGLATKILVLNSGPDPAAKLGLTLLEATIIRKILLQQGVPETAIAIASDEVSSTYQEARAVRHWVGTNHLKAMIVATDVFHARRVRWLFRKQFQGSGVQVLVRAVPVREYTVTDWWRHEQGILALQNEVLKFAYYRLKY